MATTLPKTGVVIVGVGAAGGVAALPLAEAGIDVVGLEAGSWLSTRDMAPDELQFPDQLLCRLLLDENDEMGTKAKQLRADGFNSEVPYATAVKRANNTQRAT